MSCVMPQNAHKYVDENPADLKQSALVYRIDLFVILSGTDHLASRLRITMLFQFLWA